MDTRQAKRQLRKQARAHRRALAGAAPGAAKALAACAAPVILRDMPGMIAGYWAIGEEMDPWPLVERLQDAGRAVALPCVETAAAPLVFRRWRSGDALRSSAFGLMEPGPEAPAVRPDVLLVPLLAFDRAGYRLGYGGGYYDRTIAALVETGSRPWLVGLGYAGQEVAAVPRADHDAPVDMIATETELIRPGRKDGEETDR